MEYLLFCAIRSKEIASEAVYSILSLYNLSESYIDSHKIVIITDFTKDFFEVLMQYPNIIIEEIDQDTVREWIGEDNYIFTVKIKAIKYFIEKYDKNVLFFDTDVIFEKKIDQLHRLVDSGEFVMNFVLQKVDDIISLSEMKDLSECDEKDRDIINCFRELRKESSISSKYKSKMIIDLPKNFAPYNSGALGIHKKYKYLLAEVEEITRYLYKKYAYWCAEEFAFSYVFDKLGKKIYTCEDIIYHYADFDPVRALMGRTLNYFHLDDRKYYEESVQFFDLDKNIIDNLKVEEIPYYINYVLNSKTSSNLINTLEHSMNNQFQKKNILNFKYEISKLKKFYKKMHAVRLLND